MSKVEVEPMPASLDSRSDNSAPAAPLLQFKDITKRFRRGGSIFLALDGLNLSIEKGEFVCVVGPSGCGKTTLLNMTAGLMEPSAGEVLYHDNPVPFPNTNVGYVTQKDNLLPWRTVSGNVSLALEARGVSKKQSAPRVAEILDRVGLGDFAEVYPTQLSGGMRKRVSLARTLVYEPEVILADEPFGALDAQLKLIMQADLLRIWGERGEDRRTILFITHDLTEAVTLADRVVVLSKRPGKVLLDCRIDLPRPRDVMRVRFDPRFAELHEQVWAAIGDDFLEGEDAK